MLITDKHTHTHTPFTYIEKPYTDMSNNKRDRKLCSVSNPEPSSCEASVVYIVCHCVAPMRMQHYLKRTLFVCLIMSTILQETPDTILCLCACAYITVRILHHPISYIIIMCTVPVILILHK